MISSCMASVLLSAYDRCTPYRALTFWTFLCTWVVGTCLLHWRIQIINLCILQITITIYIILLRHRIPKVALRIKSDPAKPCNVSWFLHWLFSGNLFCWSHCHRNPHLAPLENLNVEEMVSSRCVTYMIPQSLHFIYKRFTSLFCCLNSWGQVRSSSVCTTLGMLSYILKNTSRQNTNSVLGWGWGWGGGGAD